jgi:hypothetical protein
VGGGGVYWRDAVRLGWTFLHPAPEDRGRLEHLALAVFQPQCSPFSLSLSCFSRDPSFSASEHNSLLVGPLATPTFVEWSSKGSALLIGVHHERT